MKFLSTVSIVSLLLCTSCGGGGGGGDGSSGSDNHSLASRTMAGHWNHVAIDSSGFDHSAAGAKENLGPTRASRAMAIVHIAMFDGANAASGLKYRPYLLQESQPGASVEAAIAQAAHDSLVSLFPAQRANFDQQLTEDLALIPEGEAKQVGAELGAKAAQLIVADRAHDGSDAATQNQSYAFSQEPGKWRVDPTNPGQKPLGAHWGEVRPFVVSSSSQFRAAPPPSIDSSQYAEAFAEVFRLGGDGVNTPTERTQEQTEVGLYWAYDGTPTLCAPPRLYNQLTMQIANDRGISDNLELARLLAILNVSMADAGITSWESKFFYNYWRPVTAIRESDAGTGPTGKGDGNAQTFGDPSWTPLGAPASNLSAINFTPPFPAYVSGHATFGGALFQTLRNYFGTDNISFTFTSDELNGVTVGGDGNTRPLQPRSFSTLSEAEEENGQSRIYLGIHYSFDKTEGIKMGNNIANWVYGHAFQPNS